MADQQLSTRDLSARSEADESDTSPETEQPADRNTPVNSTGDEEPPFETAQSDQPPVPDRAGDGPQTETRFAGTGADATADDADVAGATGDAEPGMPEAPVAAGDRQPLLPHDQSERFTMRWKEIQTSFVDQPRDAVVQADTLVADLMQRLAASFSHEREQLEEQWDRGDDVSTEALRIALTRYRSFFDRLLSA